MHGWMERYIQFFEASSFFMRARSGTKCHTKNMEYIFICILSKLVFKILYALKKLKICIKFPSRNHSASNSAGNG